MNILTLILLVIALLVVAVCCTSIARRRKRLGAMTAAFNVGASTVGTHENGLLPRLADAVFSQRHLLAKIGTDVSHVDLCGTGDIPLGVCDDEAEAAQDPINVLAFGGTNGTVKVRASAAIALGAMVVSAASGKTRTLPATTGTYYIIGRALSAASADGDELELSPCFPTQRIVP